MNVTFKDGWQWRPILELEYIPGYPWLVPSGPIFGRRMTYVLRVVK